MSMRSIWLSLPLAGLLVAGCGTTRPPLETIAAAELSIRKADENLASKHAPLDLVKAREKLEQAKLALAKDDNEQATRLAEQALVDAQLAGEKAHAARSRQSAQEMERSIGTLRSETERYAPKD